MPSVKAKSVKPKVTVRDLGPGAKKGLEKDSLRKIRGGEAGSEAMAASGYDAGKKPKPGPCVYAGERCNKVHFSPRGSGYTLLTVVIKTS